MTAIGLSQHSLRSYRRVYALLAVGILMVPLIAMQITAEVNWQIGDFLVFGAMLAALGAVIELVLRYQHARWLRATSIGLALTSFILVWAMLAVG